MIAESVVAVVTAALGGGVVTAVTTWLVQRRRVPLDIAALAQDVAARALEHARGELAAAYREMEQLRAELSAARGEVARLTELLVQAGRR